jgi:fluoride exporter
MERFLLVCGAGGLGSGARYLISEWLKLKGHPLWGTLIVNMVGSFLIALVGGLTLSKMMSEKVSLTLTTGFMGGFTTYSAFNYQTTDLATNGQTGRAALNVIVTLVGCFAAGLAGMWLARRIA